MTDYQRYAIKLSMEECHKEAHGIFKDPAISGLVRQFMDVAQPYIEIR